MQGLIALRLDQLVIGLGEMIHADIDITGCGQLIVNQHLQSYTRPKVRQFAFINQCLVLLEPRYVRIAEYRQPLRRHVDHALQGACKTLHALLGQSHHEIDIDAGKTCFAHPTQCIANHRLRLHPVHRVLHRVVQILHAETQPVEARSFERRHMLGREITRIDLASCLHIRRKTKARAQMRRQARDIRRL